MKLPLAIVLLLSMVATNATKYSFSRGMPDVGEAASGHLTEKQVAQLGLSTQGSEIYSGAARKYMMLFAEYMYSDDDAPLGVRLHESVVEVEGTLSLTNKALDAGFVDDPYNQPTLRILRIDHPLSEEEAALPLCSYTPETAPDTITPQSMHSYRINASTIDFHYSAPTVESGEQKIAIFLCGTPTAPLEGSQFEARLTGQVSFRNPYGFVPGNFFGRIPFLVLLTALNAMLFIVYSCM